MPQLGVWELLIVLVIVLLIFGASRLTGIGKGLGGAINAFRSEVKQGREEEEGETQEKKLDTSKAPVPETEPPEDQA
jgi:sec-independent protein translocase protein TatA